MKQPYESLTVLLIIIAVAGMGYYAGCREGSKTKDKYQEQVDSLTGVVEGALSDYHRVKDSIKKNSDQHEKNFKLIDEIKKTIRNEIKKQNKIIFSLPDSAVQSYVDSIRANGGIR